MASFELSLLFLTLFEAADAGFLESMFFEAADAGFITLLFLLEAAVAGFFACRPEGPGSGSTTIGTKAGAGAAGVDVLGGGVGVDVAAAAAGSPCRAATAARPQSVFKNCGGIIGTNLPAASIRQGPLLVAWTCGTVVRSAAVIGGG